MISRSACKVAVCVAALVLCLWPATASAQAVIRQPGNHPHYGVEIEPHLAFQWAGRSGADDAFGPGVRFNIPFMHNGPIKTINNNMGITFGLDLTFGDGGWGWCSSRYSPDPRWRGDDCDVTELWLPAAMQWNFWLTDVISVFGEPGFAIVHSRWSYDCNGVDGEWCDSTNSDTDLEFIFGAGGRFMFSDNIGATVRIGFPMITAGVNFLL